MIISARLALLCALVAGVAATAAAPARAADNRPAIFNRLTDCRKLTDGAARLSCYDAATAELDQAEAKGDIVVVDREQARKVRRQAFGFTMPSISLFEKGETQAELDNVTGVFASGGPDGNGKWTVRLQDGAVWTQVDTSIVMVKPRPGMPVVIKRASLGSFMLTIDGKHGFRAKRVQ